jgi:hypothetical protein
MAAITLEAVKGLLPDLTPAEKKKLHVTWHWTAGRYDDPELTKYHFTFAKNGAIHKGVDVKKNMRNLAQDSSGGYAAHVLNANSYNIGVSACGMWDASESEARKGRYGSAPMTQAQVESMLKVTAVILSHYGLKPSIVVAHEEWDSLLHKPQDRWDVCCIPHLDLRPQLLPDGTYASMNYVRQRLTAMLQPAVPAAAAGSVAPAPKLLEAWGRFVAFYDSASPAGLPEDVLRLIREIRETPPFSGLTREMLPGATSASSNDDG